MSYDIVDITRNAIYRRSVVTVRYMISTVVKYRSKLNERLKPAFCCCCCCCCFFFFLFCFVLFCFVFVFVLFLFFVTARLANHSLGLTSVYL